MANPREVEELMAMADKFALTRHDAAVAMIASGRADLHAEFAARAALKSRLTALFAAPGAAEAGELRTGVKAITAFLKDGEWADLLTTDADLAELEAEVRKLLESRRG